MVLTLPLSLLGLKTPLEKDLERCCSTWTGLDNLLNVLSHSWCWLFSYSSPVPQDPTSTLSVFVKGFTGLKPAMGQPLLLSTVFPHHTPSLSPFSLLPMLWRKTSNLLENQLVFSMLRPHHQGLRQSSEVLWGNSERGMNGGPAGRGAEGRGLQWAVRATAHQPDPYFMWSPMARIQRDSNLVTRTLALHSLDSTRSKPTIRSTDSR